MSDISLNADGKPRPSLPVSPFRGAAEALRARQKRFEPGQVVALLRDLCWVNDEIRIPKGVTGVVVQDNGGYPHTVIVRFEGFSEGDPIDFESLAALDEVSR